MNIIGLGYESGVGKDTIADYIVEQFEFIKKPFAYNLKIEAHRTYKHLGVREPEYYEGPDKEKRRKELYGPLQWNIVQFWVHMNTLCVPEPRHWVDLTLKELDPNKSYVIPDVRKELEIDAIREMGGVLIWVDRKVPRKPEAKIDKQLRGREDLFDYHLDNNGPLVHTSVQLTGIVYDNFYPL